MVEQFPNIDERLALCGWGVPDAEFASACATDRATVVFEDEMPNAVRVIERKQRDSGDNSDETEIKFKRRVKLFRFPVPEELLLADPNRRVELRVTLSYFPEPNTFRRQVSHGLDLTWDMQGPAESDAAFITRINKLARGEAAKGKKTKPFDWELKVTRRSRGTVQSDRWAGPASYLAGHKLLAVVPVLGWWERRPALRELAMPFSLIVTVRADGLDIYNPIRVAVESELEITHVGYSQLVPALLCLRAAQCEPSATPVTKRVANQRRSHCASRTEPLSLGTVLALAPAQCCLSLRNEPA